MTKKRSYIVAGSQLNSPAGFVNTQSDLSLSILKYLKPRRAFLTRVAATGKFVIVSEKDIPRSLLEKMREGQIIPVPSGTKIAKALALSLGVPFNSDGDMLTLTYRRFSSVKLPSGKVTKGAYKGGRFSHKATKGFRLDRRVLGPLVPNDPDDTDDPGPMIKGRW